MSKSNATNAANAVLNASYTITNTKHKHNGAIVELLEILKGGKRATVALEDGNQIAIALSSLEAVAPKRNMASTLKAARAGYEDGDGRKQAGLGCDDNLR